MQTEYPITRQGPELRLPLPLICVLGQVPGHSCLRLLGCGLFRKGCPVIQRSQSFGSKPSLLSSAVRCWGWGSADQTRLYQPRAAGVCRQGAVERAAGLEVAGLLPPLPPGSCSHQPSLTCSPHLRQSPWQQLNPVCSFLDTRRASFLGPLGGTMTR